MQETLTIKRSCGRAYDELRPIRITPDVFGYATASVLFEIGNTKVLCSVSLQSHVPPFLKGSKTGWLKAEYSMLPTATESRTQRESTSSDRNGRSIEISRLIGRSLRSIVKLDALGEKTIVVDCDVLQADGGTRTACITGASLALHYAVARWLNSGIINQNVLTGSIAAISVGILNGIPLLDIDYPEDCKLDADFNFVLKQDGSIVEIQGTSEKQTVSWAEFDKIRVLAEKGIQSLFKMTEPEDKTQKNPAKQSVPLFSLANRIQTGS